MFGKAIQTVIQIPARLGSSGLMPECQAKRVFIAASFMATGVLVTNVYHHNFTNNFNQAARVGNKLSNRLQTFSPVQKVVRFSIMSYLSNKEGVTFQQNASDKCVQVMFRGERIHSSTEQDDVRAHMASILESGRHPAFFSTGTGPYAANMFNLPPTIGSMVLTCGDNAAPALWTGGGVSFTSHFQRAEAYANDGGLIILAAPQDYAYVSDHAARDPKGDCPGREWELFTPGVRPEEIVGVIEVRNDNTIGEVMLNENAMNRMRINGDTQLQQLVDKLDPGNSNHQLLHQFLQPQINPSIDHAAEYEKRESQDIYHAYEKAVVSFANRHTTLNPRRVNHHAFFSQFSYEGVFSHGKVSVDAFVAESVPPLNQILEERGLKEYSPEKVNDLCDRLRERNIDLTEDFFQNHIVVEGPSNSSKAQ